MSEELITYRLEGRVAVLGLNRPDKRNAISEGLVQALRAAVLRAGEEADCGVLHGHGKHFSAGLDLSEAFARSASGSGFRKKGKRHSWHEVFDIIARGAIPWVSALHGAVVGGGLELATASHVRVADTTAFFGLPEAQRGIFVGGGGVVRIQRVVGYSVMADMMLTGRILSPEEAMQANIVRYLVPEGKAVDKAIELANKITTNPHETNWKITNLLPRAGDMSHDDGLFFEYISSNMVRPPEASERLKEFLEGRAKPLARPARPDGDKQ